MGSKELCKIPKTWVLVVVFLALRWWNNNRATPAQGPLDGWDSLLTNRAHPVRRGLEIMRREAKRAKTKTQLLAMNKMILHMCFFCNIIYLEIISHSHKSFHWHYSTTHGYVCFFSLSLFVSGIDDCKWEMESLLISPYKMNKLAMLIFYLALDQLGEKSKEAIVWSW